jgi:Raf kinase inhibitor-like YbhB/YbcL family protein
VRPLIGVLGLLVPLVVTAGCGPDREEPAMTAPEMITVTSTAFEHDQPIPTRFGCDGDGASPALAWEGVPDAARALALVVDDPDAPHGTFTHWIVLDIDPTARSVAEGAVPSGARQARNSTGDAGYKPPCPPSGTHHYRFTVYALSQPTGLPDGTGLDRALQAVDKAAIGRGRLVGTFSRG